MSQKAKWSALMAASDWVDSEKTQATGAKPISSTFSNLPDSGIVNVNSNNLGASYEGGDGNDLTLTVVP